MRSFLTRWLCAALAVLAVLLAGCPAPEPEAPVCGDSELVDGDRCVPESCGSAVWGPLAIDTFDLFVAEGGTGPGTVESPWGRLRDAMEAAGDGDRIAVGAGDWADRVRHGPDAPAIEVVGRCPELTTVVGKDNWTVDVTGSALTLRSLTVSGGDGVRVEPEADEARLVLDDVTLVGARVEGLMVQGDGASVSATDLTVTGSEDYGVAVWDTGTVELVSPVLRDNAGVGLSILRSDAVTVTAGLIAGNGGGVTTLGTPTALTGTDIAQNSVVGVQVRQGSTPLALTDVTIRETEPGGGLAGIGLLVVQGGLVDAQGLSVLDGGSYGVSVLEGAAVLDGFTIARNLVAGVRVEGPSAELTLRNGLVADTLPWEGLQGRGIVARDQASLTVEGTTVEGNGEVGVLISAQAQAEMRDSVVRGTLDGAESTGGVGLAVQNGSGIFTYDLVLEDNEGPGLFVANQSAFTGQDTIIERNTFAGALMQSSSVLLIRGRIAETLPHPAEGGGVGVFTTRSAGLINQLGLRTVTFEDLPGPSLYVTEIGDEGYYFYVMRGCTTRRTGSLPLPGGVFATGGTRTYTDPGGGLLVEGSSFDDVAHDAIMLDGAAGTLRALGPDQNTFTDIAGEPLWVQRCDGEATEVLDTSGADPSCRQTPRPIGPVLQFDLFLAEVSVD